MKNILTIIILIMGLINAQGITMTLGGNTAADKFIVENSDSEADLVVTGEGNVGIGTTAPTADLHVSGDNGLLIQGTFGNGPAQNHGTGTRMHFYPKKAAFRVGYAYEDRWDDTKIGEYSIAMGYFPMASGLASTAMGGVTMATGEYSTAMGYQTYAPGKYSTAIGRNTVARSFTSVAIGSFNIGGGSTTDWLLEEPLFEIGNGTSTIDRSNALTVLKNGNVGIGTTSPLSKLSVGSVGNTNAAIYGESSDHDGRGVHGRASYNRDAFNYGGFFTAAGTWGNGVYGSASGSSGKGVFGKADHSSGTNYGIYGETQSSNGYAGYFLGRGYFSNNVGIGETNPSDKLHVNSESGQNAFRVQVDGATKLRVFSNGGTAIGANHQATPANGLYVHGDIKNAGGVLHTSDERFKIDIKQIDNSLAKLKNIRGVYYNWNREKFPERDFTISKQIGVLAQEVEKEFPELVNTDNDGYKSVNYSKLTPILIEAIKEQQTLIIELTKRIEELENK